MSREANARWPVGVPCYTEPPGGSVGIPPTNGVSSPRRPLACRGADTERPPNTSWLGSRMEPTEKAGAPSISLSIDRLGSALA